MNDWLFKKFENQLEKNPKRTILTSWLLMFTLNLAVWGTIIFAVAIGLELVFGGTIAMENLWPR